MPMTSPQARGTQAAACQTPPLGEGALGGQEPCLASPQPCQMAPAHTPSACMHSHAAPTPTCRLRLRSRFRRSNDSFSDAGSQRGGGSRLSKDEHPHAKDGHGQMGTHQGKAELHLIGEISGASGFDQEALYCKWQLVYEPSKTWQVLRGLEKVRRLLEERRGSPRSRGAGGGDSLSPRSGGGVQRSGKGRKG
jgi:hypothetical protein